MMARTASEQEAINSFLASSFDPGFTPGPLVEEERGLVDAIMRAVEGQFSPLTYILGLALDFTLLAQRLSRLDPEARLFRRKLTEATLLARYELVTKRGKKQVNTLTFKYGAATLGIRTIEESVCDLFIKADRTGYPSAYVYNTGMWHHYKALLVDCFKLSESGRYVVGNLLIDFGLAQFPKNAYFGRTISRVRVFAEVVASYPRAAPGENLLITEPVVVG